MKYKVEIKPSGVIYDSEDNILDDALNNGLSLEYSCKTGCCGICKAKIVSGQAENENGELVESGEILTCSSKAKSNLVLISNYYPELADIKKQTLPCKVSEIKYVTDDIIVIKFRMPPKANFNYFPGQYINLNYKGLKRSYSMANVLSGKNEIEFHIRKVPGGKMSEQLFDGLKINQLMQMEGPYGTFFVHKSEKTVTFYCDRDRDCAD